MTDPQQPGPPTIAVIGVGAIAEAIVVGMSTLAEPPQIVLGPRNAEVGARLAARFDTVSVAASNQAAVDTAAVVLLCTRAAITAEVLDDLAVTPGATVISAVAGWPLARLSGHLPEGVDLVRAIPLSAVRTHEGITALYPANLLAEQLFDALGGVVVTPTEDTFDALSVTTSTVSTHLAYLATVAGWLADQGMSQAEAERFVRGVFAGLATSYSDPDHDLAELRRHHETPGGLNEAVRTSWFDQAAQVRLAEVLSGVFARITAEPR